MRTLICLVMISMQTLCAAMQEREVTTTFEGTAFSGTIVYDDAGAVDRPGVLMVPNWMGPTENSLEKAKKVAGMGYVVFMVDMYGVDVRPANTQEASAAAGAVRGDRPLMRRRINHHLQTFRDLANELPMDASQIAAIGFCFGGGTVLELARSGADVAGVVSFHGNLDTPDPEIAEQIQSKVLVLHGLDDPYVPPEQVQAFLDEMAAADVDLQFIAYGNAVHSFTNPQADQPGKAAYDALVAERSFRHMRMFFDELFGR